MLYAIVDIETTGGHASGHGITEVAIRVHDGQKVVDRYETLINPRQNIPVYIRALTGITNEMVANAPTFDQVAPQIAEILQDKVFVAHNVNFDYSFLKYQLQAAGHDLNTKKLCTVRLSRKILPGFPSYGLGKLCRQLNIEMYNRHRAGGDADATAILFSYLVSKDAEGVLEKSLKQRIKEHSLPPNLSREVVDQLPNTPGVYYFLDQKGKVVYVGKAKQLRKRVLTHFTNNKPSRQKQEFLKDIHSIRFEQCGTELMAFILEATEIKRLWPKHNRSMKRYEHAYGVYAFEDQRGFLRLAVEKRIRFSGPVYSCNTQYEGQLLIRKLAEDFELCSKFCHLHKLSSCDQLPEHSCKGACRGDEELFAYNERVRTALESLNAVLPTFAIRDDGRNYFESSLLLVEKGRFYGMGYVSSSTTFNSLEEVKAVLTQLPGNDYIRNLVASYASKNPHLVTHYTGLQEEAVDQNFLTDQPPVFQDLTSDSLDATQAV